MLHLHIKSRDNPWCVFSVAVDLDLVLGRTYLDSSFVPAGPIHVKQVIEVHTLSQTYSHTHIYIHTQTLTHTHIENTQPEESAD